MSEALRHTWADTALGRLLVTVDGDRLVYVSVRPEGALERLGAWAARYFPEVPIREDGDGLARIRTEFSDWADGRATGFETPIDMRGTEFQQSCWKQMQGIPYGGMITYRELARRMGRAGSFRAVGQAAGANPLPVVVPCHRVVSATGLGGFTGGMALKRSLLELEGALLPLGA